MSRIIALLVLASSTLPLGRAHAQWDVPVTRYQQSTDDLQPLPDERGYLRVPRLVIGGQWILPLRDQGDESNSIGAGGSLGVDVALGVAFSVGAYARAGWWREGYDYRDDFRDHALLDVGVKGRVRASIGTFSVFLGGHAGISYDWSFDDDARSEGWHIGPHVGLQVGKVVATEIEVGINHRELGGETWIEAYASLAMTIALRRVR